MKGAAAGAESPCETPEKISTIAPTGMTLVSIALAKAMERTALTLTTRVRVPLARPRISWATDPMMARVLGKVKMLDPPPTTIIHKAIRTDQLTLFNPQFVTCDQELCFLDEQAEVSRRMPGCMDNLDTPTNW